MNYSDQHTEAYSCNCCYCAYEYAQEQYGEMLAEAGSSAFMLYGNGADAMSVARYEVGPPPSPADFGIDSISDEVIT